MQQRDEGTENLSGMWKICRQKCLLLSILWLCMPTPEPEKLRVDVVDTETAEPVEETEEKQAENEAGAEEEKASTEAEKSGQDFLGK